MLVCDAATAAQWHPATSGRWRQWRWTGGQTVLSTARRTMTPTVAGLTRPYLAICSAFGGLRLHIDERTFTFSGRWSWAALRMGAGI